MEGVCIHTLYVKGVSLKLFDNKINVMSFHKFI